MTDAHQHRIVGCMCRHVYEGQAPVIQIVRQFDGFWEFTCGIEGHPEIDDFVGLCSTCNEKRLNEFLMLKDIKPGEWARRENMFSQSWEVFLLPPEEEDRP